MLMITVEKPSLDTRLGLSLERTPDGRVLVSRVSRSGLFGGTALTVGMEIVTVNDVVMGSSSSSSGNSGSGNELQEVSQALLKAPPGLLTIQVIAADAGTTTSTTTTEKSNHKKKASTKTATTTNLNSNGNDHRSSQSSSSYHNSQQQSHRSETTARTTTTRATDYSMPSQSNNNNNDHSSSYENQYPARRTHRNRDAPTAEEEEVAPGSVEILLDPVRGPPASRTTILVPHVPRLGLRVQTVPAPSSSSFQFPRSRSNNSTNNNRSHVVVRRIDPDSVFANTELKVGMRIISINDYDCTGMSVEQVSHLFRQTPRPDGLLTVVVEGNGGSTHAEATSSATAINHGNHKNSNNNAIDKENVPDTVVPTPPPEDLQERFQRYKSVRSAQQKQKEEQPIPTAKQSSRTPGAGVIRATVVKSSPTQSTGMRLKETPDKRRVRVDRIQPDSLFRDTPLRVDMIIDRINDIPVAGMSVKQVAQLIRHTEGTLIVHAKPPPSAAAAAQPRRTFSAI